MQILPHSGSSNSEEKLSGVQNWAFYHLNPPGIFFSGGLGHDSELVVDHIVPKATRNRGFGFCHVVPEAVRIGTDPELMVL